MNTRERFQKVINFEKPDRVPFFEFCPYWGPTVDRWREEGLPDYVKSHRDFAEYFGLDYCTGFNFPFFTNDCPKMPEGEPLLKMDLDSYKEIRKYLFPEDAVTGHLKAVERTAKEQQEGLPVCLSAFGYFWFPRMIMGIEPHLYSFYDAPDLYHRICEDQVEWTLKCMDQLFEYFIPDYFCMSEDMSYNLGPMLSEDMFDEFLLPYYLQISEKLKKHNILFAVDSDGQLEPMIPWLKRGGVRGVYPLEFKAGVDVNRIRANHPDVITFSAFNKLAMSESPEIIEAECQRILPALKAGGYIPSCDHQTPPAVSLENYKLYVKLLREYCIKACE
ncbi:MAG: hypothetical protein IJO96_07350 [Oscillospiraceae bacterium]|nr:hypothetical protein [Oscillospiraceae bacterium]